MKIRPALSEDLSRITEIYNEAILRTTATFDTEPKTLEERKQWLAGHGPRHPVLVGELDGVVAGWASLTAYSPRQAYAASAENSLYVESRFQGRGLGKALLTQLLEEGQRAGLHAVLARITTENQQSIRMHEKAGFFRVGTLREIGRKFDRLLDVEILQKLL